MDDMIDMSWFGSLVRVSVFVDGRVFARTSVLYVSNNCGIELVHIHAGGVEE